MYVNWHNDQLLITSHYSEADLEDFINHLFHQAMSTEQNGGNSQWQPPSQSHPFSQGWGAASAAKKARRRKKKH